MRWGLALGRLGSRDAALASILTASVILILVIAYFVDGGMHGLWKDDYSSKFSAFNTSTGAWEPRLTPQVNYRFVRYVVTPNLSYLLPDQEWLARALVLLLHLSNTLLLSLLILRVTGSRQSAIIGGLLFLVPLFAQQGLLWFTSAMDNTPALFFVLAGFHLLLSAETLRRSLLLMICGVAAWIMAMMFYESGLFVFILLPLLAAAVWSSNARRNFELWLIPLVATYAVLLPYAFFVLRDASRVGGHGTVDPLYLSTTRVPEVLSSLGYILTSQRIFELYSDVFKLGVMAWTATGAAMSVLVLAVLAVAASALLIPISRAQDTNPRRHLLLILAGLLWICLSLVPVLLVDGQPVESRILYTVLVGFIFCLVGLIGLTFGAGGPWHVLRMRVALLAVGGLVLVSSLAMAGYVRAYQLRWDLDQRQLAALHQAAPDFPGPGRVYLLPIEPNERTVRQYFDTDVVLDYYLTGVFETTWSADSAVSMEYLKGNLNVAASNRLKKPLVTGLIRKGGEITALTLPDSFAAATKIPTDRLVPFTFKNNQVVLFDSITLTSPDSPPIQIKLPLASQITGAGPHQKSIELELTEP